MKMETIDYTPIGLLIQTSGIFIALVFVIGSYRLNSLKELLIGQGIAVLNREKEGDYARFKEHLGNREISHKSAVNRLAGSIQVKEINGIEEILIRYTKAELAFHDAEEKVREPGSTGFYKKVLPVFIKTKRIYFRIRTVTSIILSLFSISICIMFFNIPFVELWIRVALLFTVVGLISTILFIWYALFIRIGQEKIKAKEVEVLKNKVGYEKIRELYNT